MRTVGLIRNNGLTYAPKQLERRLQEQAITVFIARYNRIAKPIKSTYTVEKREQKHGTLL